MKLEFTADCIDQSMFRSDVETPVADSMNYLEAEFTIKNSNNMRCTPLFRKGSEAYIPEYTLSKSPENDSVTLLCFVPSEVIGHQVFEVSLFCSTETERITFPSIIVKVNNSGYDSNGQGVAEPSKTVYEQILDKIDSINGVSKEFVLENDAETLKDSKAYTDEEISKISGSDVTKSYVDTKTGEALSSAKTYTDEQITKVNVPTKLSELADDSTHRLVSDIEKNDWSNKANVDDIPNVPTWALLETKPEYTADEVGAIPNTVTIPTKTSDLTNDSSFITDETDPTVPSHVKSITAENISAWNNKSNFSGSYNDLRDKPTIPTKTSDLNNDSGFITTPYKYEEETSGTKELKPNVFCKFSTKLSNITITLQETEGYAEYNFSFTASASGCNLSIPASVKWDGGTAPTLEANKYYEVSILNNLALISKGVVM